MSARTEAARAADERYNKKLGHVLVAFNMEKPEQAQLHQWLVKQKNRSGLIKRLLKEEMDKANR